MRLWQTTDRATNAVLEGARMPFVVGLWARHLLEQRERTVLENHLRAWVAAYSALPPQSSGGDHRPRLSERRASSA